MLWLINNSGRALSRLYEIFFLTYKIIPGPEVRMFILEMTGLLIILTPRVVKIVRIAAAN